MAMKKITILATIFAMLALFACEKYLERSPEAGATELDVFTTYEDFQGFIDPLYDDVLDFNRDNNALTMDWGGECIYRWDRHATFRAVNGDYRFIVDVGLGTLYSHYYSSLQNGLWQQGWPNIRVCNNTLKHLYLLSDATEEEKNLIEGQALFFRAYYHWEIIRAWGPMPYIDEVLTGATTEEFRKPRYFSYNGVEGWQATAERIVEDFQAAAELLPVDWDLAGPGMIRPQTNFGRPTKGAALAFAAKVLLYAGSPLLADYSGKGPNVDIEYMKRAADVAWKVLAMDWDRGGETYALTPWEDYLDMFQRVDGSSPYTSETVFYKPISYDTDTYQDNRALIDQRGYDNRIARAFAPDVTIFGGQGQTSPYNEGVTQNYVDLFEMADGTRYQPSYDNDSTRRWENRDPRFRRSIYVDRDTAGFDPKTVLKLYDNGATKGNRSQCPTSYVIHKYWPRGINLTDGTYDGFRFATPLIRLADVYLMYAEAVNEVYGASGSAPDAVGFSAVDAVNHVRARANMPPVSAGANGYDSFRELIQNERAVELCFEGHYWFDTRRWYTAHKMSKNLQDFSFDADHSNFSRVTVATRVFDKPAHYWLPLPSDQTFLYLDMYQNPGW